MVIKTGRFGKFLACSNYPQCKNTKKIAPSRSSTAERAKPVPTGENCEKCGAPLVYRQGRFGPFVACSNYPKCRYTKKRSATPEKEKEAKEENTTPPRAKKKE
jgi:DNA topoisomerase-1